MKSGKCTQAGIIITMTKNMNLLNFCSTSTVSVKIDFDAEYFRAKIFIENKTNVEIANETNVDLTLARPTSTHSCL